MLDYVVSTPLTVVFKSRSVRETVYVNFYVYIFYLLARGLAQPITLESSSKLMSEAYLEPTPTWMEIFLLKHLIRAN